MTLHAMRNEEGRRAPRAAQKWIFRAIALGVLTTAGPAAWAGELVRVRVSQFDGTEPATISSTTHPNLFVLDGSIAFAELSADNPAAPDKGTDAPGRWFPTMSPLSFAGDAGRITLSIEPKVGSPVGFGALAFRTEAFFEANPSSFIVSSSRDDFTSRLATIDLAAPRSTVVDVSTDPSEEPIEFRWIAGNDFGDFGGGPAGFSGEDVVVTSSLCSSTPRTGCAAPGASSLRLTGSLTPERQALSWSWSKGTASIADFGDPLATTFYGLCLYQDGFLGTQMPIAPGGTYGKKPCWKSLAKSGGFDFRQNGGNGAGIATVRLRAGEGKASIAVTGKGAALDIPFQIAPASNLTVQLVRSDAATCFEAVYPVPAKASDDFRYVDRIP